MLGGLKSHASTVIMQYEGILKIKMDGRGEWWSKEDSREDFSAPNTGQTDWRFNDRPQRELLQ